MVVISKGGWMTGFTMGLDINLGIEHYTYHALYIIRFSISFYS